MAAETHVGDYLVYWGAIEVDRAARVPFAPVFREVELHEVASNGGEYHVTGLSIDGVREKEQWVVVGAAKAILSVSEFMGGLEFNWTTSIQFLHSSRHRE